MPEETREKAKRELAAVFERGALEAFPRRGPEAHFSSKIRIVEKSRAHSESPREIGRASYLPPRSIRLVRYYDLTSTAMTSPFFKGDCPRVRTINLSGSVMLTSTISASTPGA